MTGPMSGTGAEPATEAHPEPAAYLGDGDFLDVEETASRALRLGRKVTVFRYPGAIHDIFLSQRRIPEEAYREVACWMQSYPWVVAASTAPP
jgi:acetyl esterase/lipase